MVVCWGGGGWQGEDGHRGYLQEYDVEAEGAGAGKEQGITVIACFLAEQGHEDAFAGEQDQAAEAQADEEDVPVSFFFREVILEVVADETAGTCEQGIRHQTICEGYSKLPSEYQRQHGL